MKPIEVTVFLKRNAWRAALPLAVVSSLILALSTTLASEKGPPTEMTDMKSIDELKALFKADAGSPRLVLLLSPT